MTSPPGRSTSWACLGACLAWLAGCATPPPPPPPEPWPDAPLARAALTEWQAWGSVVVVGWPELRPPDTAATPERFARLLGYWEAVPGGARVARGLAALRQGFGGEPVEPRSEPGDDAPLGATPVAFGAEDIGLYDRPAWSAAFISAVAQRAGLARSDLPASARHASYIDAVLARAIADPAGALFRPVAPADHAAVPGDLLCADRAALPLGHWTQRLLETGRPRPMHCDVVVRVAPGQVEAVGGNVRDLVVLRRLPADDAGRVLPAPPGESVFVLLLTTRTDVETGDLAALPRRQYVPPRRFVARPAAQTVPRR